MSTEANFTTWMAAQADDLRRGYCEVHPSVREGYAGILHGSEILRALDGDA